MEILKDLFDEKIIEIINLFIENPEKKYFLSDVANKTKVNITTTLRILQRLSEKGYLKMTVIGKARFYQLEKNEKTMALLKFLEKESAPFQYFITELTKNPRLKKVILESKENNSAKILLIGDFLPTEKINKLIEEIRNRDSFKISFVEITENQYEKLKNFQNYNLEKKIIWKKNPV